MARGSNVVRGASRAALALSVALLVAGCGTEVGSEDTSSTTSNLDDDTGPSATALLAKMTSCRKVSHAPYAANANGAANINVCGLKNAVFFKADMDIDCDGRRSEQCNSTTDPWYQGQTAATTLTGLPLDAATLPFIVLPGASSRWSFANSNIQLGSVAAVIYDGKVEYGIVGDVGPRTAIGEASYAMAKRLGINPDPHVGGVESGVTYVVFTGGSAVVSDNESHVQASSIGKTRAKQLLAEN